MQGFAPAVREGRLRGGIVIPDGFEAGLGIRRPINVQLITDGSQVNTATFLQAHLRGALKSWIEGEAAELDIPVEPVIVINPRHRTVAVYQPHAPTTFLKDGDTLTGDPVVPGWTMPVRDLFA